MNYTVEWDPNALQELAAIWLNAADRQAVTDAEARVDALLGTDPLRHGTPVAEGLYKLTVAPLTVYYSVDQAPRHVEVSKVTPSP